MTTEGESVPPKKYIPSQNTIHLSGKKKKIARAQGLRDYIHSILCQKYQDHFVKSTLNESKQKPQERSRELGKEATVSSEACQAPLCARVYACVWIYMNSVGSDSAFVIK